MKIYGKNLQDILLELPWQYKIVVAAGSVFILFVVLYIPSRLLTVTVKPKEVEPLIISSQKQTVSGGIFDPVLAGDPGTNTAWLAYAALEAAKEGGESLLRVRLASSQGGDCKNWTASSAAGFDARPDDLTAPDGQTVFRSGVWRAETPALAFDPGDPGKEWKLFAYRYFWPSNPEQALAISRHYGVIVYKYASRPTGEWSKEQWLFSPGPDYPPPPYEQMVQLHLNSLDQSLQDVTTYSRPSVISRDGALLMTLSAFTGEQEPDRIVMLISSDHGNSWAYAGTPLRREDLAALGGYTRLSGATLIEEKGKVYLAAVLGDPQLAGQGTFIFGFDDPARGLLRRDSKTGAPALLRQHALNSKAPGPLGGGFAAYTDVCDFGLLMGEQGRAAGFQIFKTHKSPSGK